MYTVQSVLVLIVVLHIYGAGVSPSPCPTARFVTSSCFYDSELKFVPLLKHHVARPRDTVKCVVCSILHHRHQSPCHRSAEHKKGYMHEKHQFSCEFYVHPSYLFLIPLTPPSSITLLLSRLLYQTQQVPTLLLLYYCWKRTSLRVIIYTTPS